MCVQLFVPPILDLFTMPGARTPRGRVAFARATSAFTYISWSHMRSSQIPSVAPNAHLDGEGSEREYSMSQALVVRPRALSTAWQIDVTDTDSR